MAKQSLKTRAGEGWRQWRSAIFLIAAMVGFFGWHINSLTPGLSSAETNAVASSQSMGQITTNSSYAPHKLLQLVAWHLKPGNIVFMRLPSILIALICLASLYYILQRWFGKTIGVLATFMAAATPWYAIMGRLAAPDIMLATPLAVGASILLLQKAKQHKFAAFILFIVALSISLYAPGVIWFMILALILRGRAFKRSLEGLSKSRIAAGILLLLILLSPLIVASVGDMATTKTILGLPSHWPQPLGFIKSLAWGVLALVWRTPYHSSWMLGRLPGLDIIQIALAVFGTYAMYQLARPKAQLLLVYLGFGLVLEALNSNLNLELLLLPAIFVLVGAGLRYLYFEWHGVFPHNPIPKFLALALIGLLTATQLLYGARYTLEAWPHSNDTHSDYRATIKG